MTTSVISDNKMPSLLYLLPCLFVPFIVFGCHYSHALNLNSFAGSTRLSAPQQAIQFSQTVLIQTIQFSISIVFVYTQLSKQFYFKQFSLV